MLALIHYLRDLQLGKAILWCYLIWYLVVVWFYFDPSPTLWINSLGISAVIGTGLMLSVAQGSRADPWQTLRLYLMPFCVSSFSALIKNQGFTVFLSPNPAETGLALLCCGVFGAVVMVIKWTAQ
jgi:hypothetical protein